MEGIEAEMDAASDARDCGAMDKTGILYVDDEGFPFAPRKFRTSAWDWSVMRTDSADVMHPLDQ